MSRARMTAEEAFQDFNTANPEVYRLFVQKAREAKARGFQRYAIKTISCLVRWHADLKPDGLETYKLNDRYNSRYARLIMQLEPDLKDFFNIRVMAA